MNEANIMRNVYCLLGLPFDIVTGEQTVAIIHDAISNKKRCFLSTPNTNFLIASQQDSAFRDSVINSHLSIADGKPIVWIARLLNIPIPERVAGSDLIEDLIENKNKMNPIKVFFFGGENGVAESACKKLTVKQSGLVCAGSMNPGFVSVEKMSTDTIISTINEAKPDFIIVSLGAKKGQTWIQKNINRLNAPVISHLGAVVNFIAGTVQRSPVLLRKLGLEWVWRIKEEPALWCRYLSDGMALSGLLVFRVLPLSLLLFRHRVKCQQGIELELTHSGDALYVYLNGFLGLKNNDEINTALIKAANSSSDVTIVIKEGSYPDATFIAKLQLLGAMINNNGHCLRVVSESSLATKIFRYNCCEYLLESGQG